MDQLIRRIMAARGIKRRVVPVPLIAKLGTQVAAGGLLPTDEAGAPVLGTETFDEWLARVYP